MLLHGGETLNIEMPSDDSNSQLSIRGCPKLEGNQRHGCLQNNYGHNYWNLEGRALSALNRFGENARMVSEPVWLQRIQHQQALMELPGNQLLKIS